MSDKAPRHLQREWYAFPDLFAAPMPWNLALSLHYVLVRHFKVKAVLYQVNRDRQHCTCMRIGRKRFQLHMRKDFTAGELLHEWTHVICFLNYGDGHSHVNPRDATNRSCAWPGGQPHFERIMFGLCNSLMASPEAYGAILDAIPPTA